MKTSKVIIKVSEQKKEDAQQSVQNSCWKGSKGFYGYWEFDHKRANKFYPLSLKGKPPGTTWTFRQGIRTAGRKAGGTAVYKKSDDIFTSRTNMVETALCLLLLESHNSEDQKIKLICLCWVACLSFKWSLAMWLQHWSRFVTYKVGMCMSTNLICLRMTNSRWL